MLCRYALKRAEINLAFFLWLLKRTVGYKSTAFEVQIKYMVLHFATCATTLLCELSGYRAYTINIKTHNSFISIVVGYI